MPVSLAISHSILVLIDHNHTHTHTHTHTHSILCLTGINPNCIASIFILSLILLLTTCFITFIACSSNFNVLYDPHSHSIRSPFPLTRSSADADNALDAFSGQSRPCGISDGTFTHVRHMTNVVTLKLGSEVTQGH